MFLFSERLTALEDRLLYSKEKSNPAHETSKRSSGYGHLADTPVFVWLFPCLPFCCLLLLGFNMRPEFESVNESSLYKGRDAILVHCC